MMVFFHALGEQNDGSFWLKLSITFEKKKKMLRLEESLTGSSKRMQMTERLFTKACNDRIGAVVLQWTRGDLDWT